MSKTDELVERNEAGRWVVPPKSPGRPVGPSAAKRIADYIRPHEKAGAREFPVQKSIAG